MGWARAGHWQGSGNRDEEHGAQAAAGDAARLKQALADGQAAAAQRAALQAQAEALQRWAPCRRT